MIFRSHKFICVEGGKLPCVAFFQFSKNSTQWYNPLSYCSDFLSQWIILVRAHLLGRLPASQLVVDSNPGWGMKFSLLSQAVRPGGIYTGA